MRVYIVLAIIIKHYYTYTIPLFIVKFQVESDYGAIDLCKYILKLYHLRLYLKCKYKEFIKVQVMINLYLNLIKSLQGVIKSCIYRSEVSLQLAKAYI